MRRLPEVAEDAAERALGADEEERRDVRDPILGPLALDERRGVAPRRGANGDRPSGGAHAKSDANAGAVWALSVKKYRVEGENLVLTLRSGGEISCSGELIARIEPDEVQYPEDVLVALPAAQAIIEPPAIPEAFRDIISVAAARHGVDARLVHALIQVESAYHSNARSPKGAMGLMQVLPGTGRDAAASEGAAGFTPARLLEPATNILLGTRHLAQLIGRCGGRLELALA